MPRAENILYSYCGLVCSYCKAYLNGLCKGCDVHEDECEYIKCCRRKNVRCCLECNEFPCNLHTNGFSWETEEYGKLKWRVYSDVFLEIFKRM